MIFLAFEGTDGAGKSTLIQGLTEQLKMQNLPFIVTREPGGTVLGDEIRHLLLRRDQEAPSPRTELLLYEAIRAQHVDTKIKPALKAGQWVLCDRFAASSLAFQAGGRQLDEAPVRWLNDFATNKLYPHLNVLLDLPVSESQKRMGKRMEAGQRKDRFELEEDDFHERVRQYYLKMAKTDANQWLVLDATQKPSEILQNLLAELRKHRWLS